LGKVGWRRDRNAEERPNQEQDGPAENQVAFTVGVIVLGAKMAKADGVVTR
jgi:DnaJ like chaperone protein